MSPDKILRGKVAALWALLGILSAFCVAGSVFGIASWKTKAPKSAITQINKKIQAGEKEAAKAACAYVASTAAAQGIIITSCKEYKGKNAYKAKGDEGQVAVTAIGSGKEFLLVVSLNRGTWVASDLQVAGVKDAPKPKK
jgi:hypothetical protein